MNPPAPCRRPNQPQASCGDAVDPPAPTTAKKPWTVSVPAKTVARKRIASGKLANRRTRRVASLSTVLAVLLAGMVLAGFFTLLFTLAGIPLAFFAAVAGGLFAISALHYALWGWWVTEYLRREEEQADEQRPSSDR